MQIKMKIKQEGAAAVSKRKKLRLSACKLALYSHHFFTFFTTVENAHRAQKKTRSNKNNARRKMAEAQLQKFVSRLPLALFRGFEGYTEGPESIGAARVWGAQSPVLSFGTVE